MLKLGKHIDKLDSREGQLSNVNETQGTETCFLDTNQYYKL